MLTVGFESELKIILSSMCHPRRQTMLFSATLNSSLLTLESLAMKDTLRFDLTTEQRIPKNLSQEYLFMPPQVKMCFLIALMNRILGGQLNNDRNEDERDTEGFDVSEMIERTPLRSGGRTTKSLKRKRPGVTDAAASIQNKSSVIIFAGSCKRCQETAEILLQLKIECVSLHSMVTQNRRRAALGMFKSQQCRVLVATDLASRGLDIPHVDYVINYDLPQLASDYVHRIGRTARAGKAGRSISLVTPHEVDLLKSIESYTGVKLSLAKDVNERDVVPYLNPVAKAMKSAQLRMMEQGQDESLARQRLRRRKAQRKQLRKRSSVSHAVGGDGLGKEVDGSTASP